MQLSAEACCLVPQLRLKYGRTTTRDAVRNVAHSLLIMPPKRVYEEEGEDAEAPVPADFSDESGRMMSLEEIVLFANGRAKRPASKGLSRPISPPPTKRQKASGRVAAISVVQDYGVDANPSNAVLAKQTNLTTASKPSYRSRDHIVVCMFDRDSGQIRYMKYSHEQYLRMLIDRPDYISNKATYASQDPSLVKLEEYVQGNIEKQLEHIDVDGGGFALVEWGDDKQPVKRPDRGDDLESDPINNVTGVNKLCYACQKVVKDSSVIHAPWRKVGKVERLGSSQDKPYIMQEELEVEYEGPTVNIYKHHAALGDLKRSALAGCHLCSLLDAFNPKEPFTYDERSRRPYTLKVIYAINHQQGPGVILVDPRGRTGPAKAAHMMYETPSPVSAPTLNEVRTDAQSILELAKQWLHECLTTHDACRARAAGSTGFIPTRLIKVKGVGKHVHGLNLVIGRELPQNTKYLTLSHCWGGADIVKLTEDTLDDFEIDIPRSRLPKNFAEAVSITSTLGYEYIWIDSLCIIQDSAEDWRHEAAFMGSVYRHSMLTIAALGAKDSHGGCFQQRSALSFLPCQLIPRTKEHPGVYAENWFDPPAPLHTRAWVVQERCLSVRTLNFGLQMLSWDCIAANASELEPTMKETKHEGSLKRTFDDILDSPMEEWLESRRRIALWRHNWWELIRTYSSMNITYATDKWPAIQGLANEVEKDRKQKLVHGMWKYALPDEVLWCIDQPKAQRLEIGEPSWSWLSIEGKVHKWVYNYHEHFKIDATVRLCPEISSNLKIIGRMLRLSWVQTAPLMDSTPSFSFWLRDGQPRVSPGKVFAWDGRWIPDTLPDEKWETWALQIVRTNDDEELKERAGLVVVPVEGNKNTWRRVGFYDMMWRDESHIDPAKRRWFGYWTAINLV